MTGPSLRSHIVDVLAKHYDGLVDEGWEDMADALLADPTLAAILDLAAVGLSNKNSYTDRLDPEVRALLAAWRAER